MNHPIDLLADLLDGSISHQERAVVEAHLASCAACREQVALAGAGREALRALPAPIVPAGIAEAAIAEAERLAHEDAPEVAPLRRRSRAGRGGEAPPWYRWAGAAAAAAALLLVLVVALPKVGTEDGVQPTAAERGAGIPYDGPADLEVQDADYDTALVQQLALSYRVASDDDVAGAPTAEMTGTLAADLPSGKVDPEGTADALGCLRTAFPTLTEVPARLIAARFDGAPAYLGVFLTGPGAGQPPDTVTVWVAARHDCSVLSSTQASLSP